MLEVKNVSQWFGSHRRAVGWLAKLDGFANDKCYDDYDNRGLYSWFVFLVIKPLQYVLRIICDSLPEKWVKGTKPNRVLADINIRISAGQIVSLVGPSGCGKSTLLRAILGTHLPKRGKIKAGNRIVRGPSRDVGIVYQHYSLPPNLTALEAVAEGLKFDQTTLLDRILRPWHWFRLRRGHLAEAQAWLMKLGLEDAKDQYPSQLSGGMRQRVAIAQALIMRPKILLLDEPFGALDEATREKLQLMLLHLYKENEEAIRLGNEPPYTILIVTHELSEALYVSNRVVGLSQFHSDNLSGGKYQNVVGARIVYDKAAPVFQPEDPREFSIFFEQLEELRSKALDPNELQHHEECVTFWRDHEKVHGVVEETQ